MESERIMLGALIFILLIVGSNLVMYAIARGAVKGGDSRWVSTLKNTLNKPFDNSPANKSMDELRRQVDELKKRKNDG